MARQGVYELRLMSALLLRGGEAYENDLAGAFERPSHLRQAIESLAQSRAIVQDRQQSRLRLLPGRCLELLGLARVPASQGEMFSEECLLPGPDMTMDGRGARVEGREPATLGPGGRPPGEARSPGGTAPQLPAARPVTSCEQVPAFSSGGPPVATVPAAVPGSPPQKPVTYTRDVLEISELESRARGGKDQVRHLTPSLSPVEAERGRKLGFAAEGTRLSGREKAKFEQAATERAQAVATRFRGDQYLVEKLSPRRRLREELFEGKTPTARKFAVLYATQPDRARELLGAAVQADNPAANLNVRLQAEGVRY